jgi:hypothetical protein
MKPRSPLIVLFLIFLVHPCVGQEVRRVRGNKLISDTLPKITVEVDGDFTYVGRFDFKIRDVAAGERFVFVDAGKDKKVRRLFLAQFEGFLPSNTHTYNYNFENAAVMGGHKFRQNTWAYSNAASEKENPQNEGVLTARFLREKGYKIEDEFMMSRFVTVPDAERRNEMILYYLENVSTSGRRLSEFYIGDEETQVWREISKGLTGRSLKAFRIG